MKNSALLKCKRLLACCAIAAGAVVGCCPSKPVLRIYTWSDYIAPEVIARFERENGCKVVIDTFDSNEAMFENLQQSTNSYDIITPSSYQIPAMMDKCMLLSLDHRMMPNVRRNFDAHFSVGILDPSFAYSVPYAVTYTGFMYRKDKVGDAPIDSWKIFDTPALKGRMSLLMDMRETLGGALMALGYSINSTKQSEIAAAAKKVMEWKANVSTFDNEIYKAAVASNVLVVGHGYSSDAIQAMLNDPGIGFSLPKEGFSLAFDEMVISSSSSQTDLAHKFINFCYDPEVAAENMSKVCCPMPVATAFSRLDEKLRKLVLLDAETLRHGESIRNFDDQPNILDMYKDAWERITDGM